MMTCSRSTRRLLRLPATPSAIRVCTTSGLALAGAILNIACGSSEGDGGSSGGSDPLDPPVTIEWVTVRDAGNVADTEIMCCADDTGGYGSVSYAYRIGKFEVTFAQYAEFLNAVAANDTNALYNSKMGLAVNFGGITRSGGEGSFSYDTIPGRENMPVNRVSFWDATRFANWLHNGQPTGAQDGTTTEDGAYTLTADGITNNTVTRNTGATVFVSSEDEWYKAAYYKGGDTGAGYWDYPAESDTTTICDESTVAPNSANCGWSGTGDLTDVGSYTGSASPSGTFDQGGNVSEWTDAVSTSSRRVRRGGDFANTPFPLAASVRISQDPSDEGFTIGFRVASPVP